MNPAAWFAAGAFAGVSAGVFAAAAAVAVARQPARPPLTKCHWCGEAHPSPKHDSCPDRELELLLDAMDDLDPVTCVCETPTPDGLGECSTCRRPRYTP